MTKASCIVQMYIHISKKGINISLHINLNVLRNFMTLYGLDSPDLNRMGLKKDMRNDNLFFKRVTDIIIPDYPLSIDM